MVDPRIEHIAKKVDALTEAILVLANYIDGLAWRAATPEERDASITIHAEIRKILEA